MQGHTGKELAESLLEFLKAHDIAIADCRGQSYDNASNMSGKYNGMQAIIRQQCNLAEYVPCAAHSLNLVARADATKALVKGYDEINDALVEIADDEEKKAETREEARGLATKMNQLETGILAALWHHILHRFHANSQALQSADQDLNSAVAIYESLMDFIGKQRARFEEFEAEGKKLSQCDQYVGEEKRVRKRNRRYDEPGSAPEVSQTPANKFRTDTFLVIIDKIDAELGAYTGIVWLSTKAQGPFS
ncbi:Hypothetical predicted protein [Paramuricea clavata]|uniref:Uncharacterized protein n=1 Tax=Paramuricea clavata TaxID=317549 RepID=A0A7D9ED90_PARCT|nr:Hypothetical predicted protein [Paramuricea clavata]